MIEYFRGLWKAVRNGWPAFWFEPRGEETLTLLRIATGLMLAYIHLVWFIGIEEFFGPNALIDRQTNSLLHKNEFTWTYLRYFDSIAMLRIHQILAIVISLMLALGIGLRVVAPLAWFMTLMVCHRATGHLFGLDQVTMMLAFGLAIAYLFEQRLSLRSSSSGSESKLWKLLRLPSDLTTRNRQSIFTFATRLIQLQLCAMYLFGGLGKMRGSMWWDGSAIWFSAASYEYQSLDMTWIGHWPLLASLIAHATILWETFYFITVWPKWSRPITLGMAVLVHLGIALYLGMITFGLMMIVANAAFINPSYVRRLILPKEQLQA